MKAVLLCAGFGSRLGYLTQNRPKPMLPVGGQPLLVRIIYHLKENGINDLAINLHYQPKHIVSAIGDGKHLGVSVRYSYEDKPLGTAGALVPLQEWLEKEEAFIVYYGDIYTEQNLTTLLTCHATNKSYATLLLHRRKNSNSIVQRNSCGRITCFVERPSENQRNAWISDKLSDVWVNSGIQVLSRKALKDIVRDHLYDLPKDLYTNKFSLERMYSVPLCGFRIAVDSEQRYHQLCDYIDNKNKLDDEASIVSKR
jgi:NDP-sugar pyrophosphorylase family protein